MAVGMRRLSERERKINAALAQEEAGQERRIDRVKAFFRWFLPLLGLYLDDLLMVAAGICFTASAALTFGCGAALAVAGTCLLGYGIVIARSRGGGSGQ